jgi:hypothetical protein
MSRDVTNQHVGAIDEKQTQQGDVIAVLTPPPSASPSATRHMTTPRTAAWRRVALARHGWRWVSAPSSSHFLCQLQQQETGVMVGYIEVSGSVFGTPFRDRNGHSGRHSPSHGLRCGDDHERCGRSRFFEPR